MQNRVSRASSRLPARVNEAGIVINKASATVTAGSDTKGYGTADPVLTPSSTGFVPSDGIVVTQTARDAGEAGNDLIYGQGGVDHIYGDSGFNVDILTRVLSVANTDQSGPDAVNRDELVAGEVDAEAADRAHRGRAVAAVELEQMVRMLVHRGPDGGGVWTAPGVALGHRRLSIIDLAGSPQPMAS